MSERGVKYLRIGSHSDSESGTVAIMNEPSEVRISAKNSAFLSVSEDGISIGGSTPSKVNVQGLSHSVRYGGGLISDLPWPLTMIPSTTTSPLPQQIFIPPFNFELGPIKDLANLSTLIMSVLR